jgi:hypothetical protein
MSKDDLCFLCRKKPPSLKEGVCYPCHRSAGRLSEKGSLRNNRLRVILGLLDEGRTHREIAAQLGVSGPLISYELKYALYAGFRVGQAFRPMKRASLLTQVELRLSSGGPWAMAGIINRLREAAGGVVGDQELIAALYDKAEDGGPLWARDTIKVMVHRLRAMGYPIKTHWGRGYSFAPRYKEVPPFEILKAAA